MISRINPAVSVCCSPTLSPWCDFCYSLGINYQAIFPFFFPHFSLALPDPPPPPPPSCEEVWVAFPEYCQLLQPSFAGILLEYCVCLSLNRLTRHPVGLQRSYKPDCQNPVSAFIFQIKICSLAVNPQTYETKQTWTKQQCYSVFIQNELHTVKTPLKQPQQPPHNHQPSHSPPPTKKKGKKGKSQKIYASSPLPLEEEKKVNSHNPALYLRNGQTGGSRPSVHDIVEVSHPTAKSAVKRQAAAGRMRQNQVSNTWHSTGQPPHSEVGCQTTGCSWQDETEPS